MIRLVVAAGLIAGCGTVAWYAEAQDAQPAARLGDDEAGRLPPGYTVVVTKQQRAKVYAIQDSYQKQLDDLQKQIAAIEAKRDSEIAALLTEEQKKILGYVLKLRESERKQDVSSN